MEKRKCKICGKLFEPRSGKQVYCKDQHYLPCPVCGKRVPVKYNGDKPRTCSSECMRKLSIQTNLSRYGVEDAGNRPEAAEKRRNTNISRYGVEHVFQSDEFKESSRKTCLDKYGVENGGASEAAKIRREETSLSRYGVRNAMQNEDVKKRSKEGFLRVYGVDNPMKSEVLRKKANATNVSKYGVPWAISSKQVRDKSNQTMLERYGSIDPSKVKSIRDKAKCTCLERYGVPHYMQSHQFRDRFIRTMQEKYGVDNPGQHPDIRKKIESTNMERYGLPYAFMSDESHEKARESMLKNMKSHISSYNLDYLNMFKQVGLSDAELEFHLKGRWYDIIIPSRKILVEINPTYTHSIEPSFYYPNGDFPKMYHRDKTQLALDNGYRCIHVFDWDDPEDICKLVASCEVIYARNCMIQFISEEDAASFIDENHVQKAVRNQLICIGLLYQDKLVGVMTFGVPRYTKKYQWEMLRMCFQAGVRVVGGASKMFKYFLDNLEPTSIVSYCNLAKFTGSVYESVGMHKLRVNSPNKLWSKGDKVITNQLLLQRGYDQLFGTSYGKGTSNEDLMRENGWRSVYDCGQAVYVYMNPADLR